jgi:hypothetical protein
MLLPMLCPAQSTTTDSGKGSKIFPPSSEKETKKERKKEKNSCGGHGSEKIYGGQGTTVGEHGMYLGGVEDLPRWALLYGRIRATEGELYRRSGGWEREREGGFADSGENGTGSGQRRGERRGEAFAFPTACRRDPSSLGDGVLSRKAQDF